MSIRPDDLVRIRCQDGTCFHLAARDVSLSQPLMILVEDCEHETSIRELPTTRHRVVVSFVCEYLREKKGKDEPTDFDKAFLLRVQKKDKLSDEVGRGETTVEEEQKKVEDKIQSMLRQNESLGIVVESYQWPKLGVVDDPPSDFKLIRDRLERQAKAHRKQRQTRTPETQREYVFDLLHVALYWDIKSLTNLCISQVNLWRSKCPLLCRDWSMARKTRLERLAAVELVIAFKKRQENWTRQRRMCLYWRVLPNMREIIAGERDQCA